MARMINFFDAATSGTTPTIGNLVASNLVKYANDAAYVAGESGAPTTGNIYYNTTEDSIRYYNGSAWVAAIAEDGLSLLIYDNATSGLTATDAQAAIDEVEGRLDTAESTLSTHVADTTNPHSVTAAQVGLGNVDNTSDATKNAAVATLANKTLDAPVVDNSVVFVEEASTPANPSAGYKKLYPKTDGKLYTLDSSGSEVEVGSGGGSGSGGINYISNPDMETDLTGWSTYDDGASATPVDGTGGSPSAVTTTHYNTFPVRGSYSLYIGKAASNGQGEGVSIDFEIDRADNKPIGKKLNVSFEYATASSFDDFFRVYIYDIDNAALIGEVVNSDTGQLVTTNGLDDTIRTFQGEFFTTTSVNYRLIFHCVSTSTTGSSFVIDNVKVGPDSSIPGYIAADLGTEAWTDDQANATTSVKLYRRGKWVRVVGTVSYTGAQSGALNITIPAAYTPDSAIYTEQSYKLGDSRLVDVGTQSYVGDVNISSAALNTLRINVINSSATYPTSSTSLSATVPHTWANGDRIFFDAEWIVDGWVESAALSTTEASLSTVKAKYTLSSSTANASFADNSAEIVDYDTKVYDTHNAVTTGASWKFTAPKTGKYEINASLLWVNKTNLSQTTLVVYKNGSADTQIDLRFTEGSQIHGSTVINLNKDDYIDIRALQDDSTSAARAPHTATTPGLYSHVSIEEKPDFSTFSVYGETDKLESSQSSTTYSITAGQWGDLTSLTLTPGEWDIFGQIAYDSTGATTTGIVGIGMSSTSGNSAPTGGLGVDQIFTTKQTASGSKDSVNMHMMGVSVTSPTTYYLKSYASVSITNLNAGYKISARKVK